jgi:hypothetical protein
MDQRFSSAETSPRALCVQLSSPENGASSRRLFELSLPPAKQLFEQCSALVHACVRVNGTGLFVHDPLDGVSAAAALGAASEAGIDLAHAGPPRLFCDN